MRRAGARFGVVVASALLLSLACEGRAQQALQVDAGSFEHRLDGTYFGSETFAVRRQGQDLVVVGRITREPAEGGLQAIELGMRIDASGQLVRYEAQSREGPPMHTVLSRAGTRLQMTMTSGAGERFTEHLADERLLVLEPDIAHHYVPLALRLRAAADPRSLDLEVLVPSRGRKESLRVSRLSRDTLAIATRWEPVTRYDIMVGGEAASVWVATDSPRVMQVAIPGRGWAAVRTPRE